MRILVLAAHLPYPPNTGGAIRTHSLMRGLARRNELHLLSAAERTVPPSFADELRRCYRSVTILPRPGYHRLAPRTVSEIVEREAIDLVFCSYLDTASLCAHLRRVPVVVDLYDILSHLALGGRIELIHPWSSLRRFLRFVRARRLERAAARLAAVLSVVSEDDLQRARSFAADRPIFVVPNGVDLTHNVISPMEVGDANALLFVGGFHWQPNVEAAQFFCREVFPRVLARNPASRLTLVGGSPPPSIQALAGERVTVTGHVDDVRPFYRRSRVAVVPLLTGSGTRLKVLEAMAMGRPVVSTTVGAEGLPVRDGHDLLIADEPEAFAEKVLGLQHDEEQASRIARHARQTIVAAGYDWESIAERLEQVLAEVLRRSRPLSLEGPRGRSSEREPAGGVG